MNFEKLRDILNLPFFILLAYSILCFFRVPDIADGMILASISALYGFKLFLNSKIIPTRILSEKEEALLKARNELAIQIEMQQLSNNLKRMTASQESSNNKPRIKF